MEDGTVPRAIRNTIECTLRGHSIVKQNKVFPESNTFGKHLTYYFFYFIRLLVVLWNIFHGEADSSHLVFSKADNCYFIT